MKPMRIAYVSPYYRPAYLYGGPVNGSAALCEGMARAGAEVTVLTTNANGEGTLDVLLRQPVDVEGVTVYYYPLALGGLSYSYSRELRNAAATRVRGFDLVVIATIWGHPLIPTARACIRHRVPYIIPAEGQLNPWAMARKGMKKALYMRAVAHRFINRAAGIRCTDPLEADAVDKLGFRPPTFIVPNPIRASDYKNPRGSGGWRGRLNIPADARILLFLGRLERIKRPDIAVDVLGAAQVLPWDVHLIVAGPDEAGLVPQLKYQASGLGCSAKLHFTGLLNREDVASILSEAELLMMPSEIQENFGMSALEALASGVPVLVSEGVPVGKWAHNVGAGRVVPCTAADFRTSALELLSHPDHLSAMGANGQNLVGRHFDIDVVARQMLSEFVAIIATGRPLPRFESQSS